MSNYRLIDDDGSLRLLEDGSGDRLLEGVDIGGPVSVSSAVAYAGGGLSVSGPLSSVSVVAISASAVGYTSATGHGLFPVITVTGLGAVLTVPAAVTGDVTDVSVNGVSGAASGAGGASGTLGTITLTTPNGSAVGYTSATGYGLFPVITVADISSDPSGEVQLAKAIPGVSITPPQTDAGGGGYITSSLGKITVTTPDGSAVGYTSATGYGLIPEIDISGVTPDPHTAVLISGGMPTVNVTPALAFAVGGGNAIKNLAEVTIGSVKGSASGRGDAQSGLPEISVTGVNGDAVGQGHAVSGIPLIEVSEVDGVATGEVDIDPGFDVIGVSGPLGEGFILASGEIGQVSVSPVLGDMMVDVYGDIGTITVSVPKNSTGYRIKVREAVFRSIENCDAVRQIRRPQR